MTGLDARSVVLLTGLMGLLMSMVLFFLRRSYPASIKGLTEWAVAPALLFIATLLFAARGMIPDLLSIVLANLLLFSGSALFYFGSQRFFGLTPSIKLWGTLILLTLIPLSWFALAEPHHGNRLAFITGFMAMLTFVHFRLILVNGSRCFSNYLTGATLLILALTQARRFTTTFSMSSRDITFDNTEPGQAIQLSIYAFVILMQTIGYVLMATDKLRGELEHLATHDSLTGTLNRRALFAACTLELARGRRNHKLMALLILDLDHFKAINDKHGHLMGDRILVDFVARISPLLRLPDRFGRFGGEEFVVLLPETSLEEARIVAERIRAAVEATDRGLPAYTVSIGVTISQPEEADVDGVIARADKALYQAKAAGRNRIAAVTHLDMQ